MWKKIVKVRLFLKLLTINLYKTVLRIEFVSKIQQFKTIG